MSLSESRFNMWRAVTAVIYADEVVKPHEVNFILENIRSLPLSEEQREILTRDLNEPGDIGGFFRKISSPRDKTDFFHLARALSWSDGEFSLREKELLENIRLLAVAPSDMALMESAVDKFRDIYIEGSGEKEASILTMIRGLLRQDGA